MEKFNVWEIIILVFGSGSVVTGMIAAATFIKGWLKEAGDKKQRALDLHFSKSTEFERLQLESMSFTKETFIETINILRVEIIELKAEVKACEKHREEDRLITNELKEAILSLTSDRS